MQCEILRFDNVSKYKGNSTVLKNINFTVKKGEIMGLMHISSLGLPQLLELICHNLPIDLGNIYFDGKLINTYRHSDNSDNPVKVVGEQCSLIPNVTIAENLFIMQSGPHPLIFNKRSAYLRANKLLLESGLKLSANTIISDLTPGERSTIEMLSAYTHENNLVILLEPESYLGVNELSALFRYARLLTQRGMTFLYIGNQAETMFKVCNKLAIMDKGCIIKIVDKEHMNMAHLNPFLPVLPLDQRVAVRYDDQTILCFNSVYSKNLLGLTFQVLKGSCTALVDELGNASNDIINIMSLKTRLWSGSILVEQNVLRSSLPTNMIKNRIAFITLHPTETMLFPDMSYLDNLCLQLDLRCHEKLIKRKVIRSVIHEFHSAVGSDIYAKDLHSLSSVSLYNLIYYRIRLMHPHIVFINRPFSGCDMALRVHIQSLIKMLKTDGITIVILTMSIADTIPLADDVLHIQNGAIS